MLRTPDAPGRTRWMAVALLAGVGALAAWLVALGNPGNMGLCGACFLRDAAGALGLSAGKGPAYLRPEILGLVLGAFLLVRLRGTYTARSGSHAGARLVLGLWMGIAALVFLGCPFRMLQRLGGGDLTAWAALPGFLAGAGLGLLLEKRGYSVGKTSPAPWPVGLLGPLAALLLLALFLKGGFLLGPGPGDAAKPPHAGWKMALGIAGAAGAALSLTGFCAIAAARQVFRGGGFMLLAAGALVAGYAGISAAGGRFNPSLSGQPIAHGDWLWNTLALALLGLTGALAGGCPVRQMVMAGEGNADALAAVAGILGGGALAHTMGLASSPEGPTDRGRIAVAAGLLLCTGYGWLVARAGKGPALTRPAPAA